MDKITGSLNYTPMSCSATETMPEAPSTLFVC